MKKALFILVFALISLHHATAQELTVSTFNVRNNNKGDSINGNGWGYRLPVIADMIRFYDFDIVGTQEVLHKQLTDLEEVLPKYSHVGVGRDDGKTAGEYAPIFYKTDKFNLLDKGDFWMAEETTYPNIGWDAALPRICSWAQLELKDGGQKIWFFNLHMDHVGKQARRESAKLVLKKITEMCGSDLVMLTGDFNVDQTHESYRLLASSDILKDSFVDAKIKLATNGTFNHFNPSIKTSSRIDHIFVSPSLEVDRYGVLTDSYWMETEDNKTKRKTGEYPDELTLKEYSNRLPSDHYPVMVKLRFGK